MSATMDADHFSQYFQAEVRYLEGRSYPVEVIWNNHFIYQNVFISRDVSNFNMTFVGHVNFELLQTIWESISTFAGKILVEHRRDDALSSFLQETLMEKMENSIVKICKYLHTHASETILSLAIWLELPFSFFVLLTFIETIASYYILHNVE